MLAELVFVTRFLGLVAGEQNVVFEAGPSVRAIEVRVDGRRELVLKEPPWKGTIDLGAALEPREVTAVAFDAAGVEVGRETQVLNIARARAELEILLDRDAAGVPSAVRLEWRHFRSEEPKRSAIRLDGRAISKTTSARLGELDPSRMHVLSAEIEFQDTVIARKELVFGGVYSEQMPANLTAVGVRQRPAFKTSRPCVFRFGGEEFAPAAVEEGPAIVAWVLNGDAGDELRRGGSSTRDPLFAIPFSEFRLVTPVATSVQQREFDSSIFPSTVVEGRRGTRYMVLFRSWGSGVRRFADALAAAGVRSLGSNRRAVVYVVGHAAEPDHSIHSPAAVRRYLDSIGVPLRVWSTAGSRPDLERVWGRVRDVSTTASLLEATSELKRELEMQRVAWLPAAPLDALRARTNDDCSYVPLARAE
jgi:hypothetical protein